MDLKGLQRLLLKYDMAHLPMLHVISELGGSCFPRDASMSV